MTLRPDSKLCLLGSSTAGSCFQYLMTQFRDDRMLPLGPGVMVADRQGFHLEQHQDQCDGDRQAELSPGTASVVRKRGLSTWSFDLELMIGWLRVRPKNLSLCRGPLLLDHRARSMSGAQTGYSLFLTSAVSIPTPPWGQDSMILHGMFYPVLSST